MIILFLGFYRGLCWVWGFIGDYMGFSVFMGDYIGFSV